MSVLIKRFIYKDHEFIHEISLEHKIERSLDGKRFHLVKIYNSDLHFVHQQYEEDISKIMNIVAIHETLAKKFVDGGINNVTDDEKYLIEQGFTIF